MTEEPSAGKLHAGILCGGCWVTGSPTAMLHLGPRFAFDSSDTPVVFSLATAEISGVV